MVFENWTYDEWQALILKERENLEDVIKNNIPQLWSAIQLITSVKCILNIADCTLPLVMILLGAASSLKTVPIEMFRRQPNTYYTDNFSAKAFVSHSTAVKKEDLAKIDMLPKIQYKLFLAPELSPIFTKKDDELVEILGIMTRVADGRGYESDTGAHGHRGYVGDYMFTMVGAAIDIPYKVHKYLGFLGPKLYFFRLPRLIRKDEDYFNQLKDSPFSVKFQNIKTALLNYLQFLEKCPKMEIDKDSRLKKIIWDSENDSDEALRIIVRLGKLLAHLRAVVQTWETYGSQGSDYAYATAMKEEPDRAMEQLRNIARGFALSKGRNYITLEDISLPIKVVLSTASIDRVNVFDLLIAHKGTLTTKIITESLNRSVPTAHRIMVELKAVDLVNLKESQYSTEEKEITLKDEFDWFLTPEFSKLREGFIPIDNSDEMSEYNGKPDEPEESSFKEKLPPITSEESSFKEKRPLITSDKDEVKDNIIKGVGGHFSYKLNDSRSTLLMNSIQKNELDISDFIKIEGSKMGNGIGFDADPATGSLLLENNFLTGSLRMRGRGGGAYPYNYLEFIDKVFGAEKNTIEVCSNSVDNNSCFTVDINPDVRPSLITDGQELGGIEDNRFNRWRSDPPYNEKTAKEMYNCELPSLFKLLEAGARVIKPGSLMFLLCSQNLQSGTIGKGNIKRIGFIYISVVPNNETRILNIYVKLPEKEI